MNNKLAYMAVIMVVVALAGCSIETSHNGALDGYWKLKTVDTLSTGGTCDLNDASIFWSVQKDLLTVRDNNDPTNREYVFRFQRSEGTLILSEGQRYDRTNGNVDVDDPSVLSPYGINHQPETFKVDYLTHRVMTLSTEELRLNFKKF